MTEKSSKNKINDLIRKSFELGFEAMNITREKLETLVNELVEAGQLTLDQKSKLITEISDKIEQREKSLYQKLSREVKEAIQEIGFATREDMEKLQKKIESLNKQFDTDK